VRKRFVEIDSLRGMAAVLVAVYHFRISNFFSSTEFVRSSWIFVDYFFVLSGFIISHIYFDKVKTKIEAKKFFLRRVFRLYPLHLLTLLLFVLIEVTFYLLAQWGIFDTGQELFSDKKRLSSLLHELFLTHSLGIAEDTSWNSPSWSISVEFYTYLVFLSICFIKFKRVAAALVLLLAVAYIVYLGNGIRLAHYGSFARCIYGFFIGLFLQCIYSKKDHLEKYMGTLVEGLAILSVALFVFFYSENSKVNLVAPVIFALSIFPFLFGKGYFSRGLRNKRIAYIGELSYTIYMMHLFVFYVINFVLQNVFNIFSGRNEIGQRIIKPEYILDIGIVKTNELILLFVLVIVIYVSHCVHKYFEKPVESKLRRRYEL